MPNPLRSIPSVSELLDSPPLRSLVDKASRNVVLVGVRTFLDNLRTDMQHAAAEIPLPTPGELAERIADWIQQDDRPILRPVINATGIPLHTGLGRAPLAREALLAITELAAGYTNLEIDLDTGERSQRMAAVRKLLAQLTGADGAVVVNNNAAATLITLTALAKDREVIVSRGQLIEIGGSYRLPEVMSASGARLREVGTTNKTRIGDFAAAIGESTGALLRVHTSNYRIVGFTEEPTLAELVALGRQHRLPVIDDIGSGAMLDFAKYGIADEPVAAHSIAAGADVVLFSGDKLLGGPQAGIIVGRRNLIDQIMRHPLMRALRVDKLTLAALTATLRLYRDPAVAEQAIPLLMLLSTSSENLRNRAERLAPQIAALAGVAGSDATSDVTFLGGGTVPAQEIATWCVAITPKTLPVNQFAKALRLGNPAVMGRVQQDRLMLDLRSVFPHQDSQLVGAVGQVTSQTTSQS